MAHYRAASQDARSKLVGLQYLYLRLSLDTCNKLRYLHGRMKPGELQYLCIQPGCSHLYQRNTTAIYTSNKLRLNGRMKPGEQQYLCIQPGCSYLYQHNNTAIYTCNKLDTYMEE